MVVEKGDTVSVWYLGTLQDGKVFDTNIIEEAKKAGTYQASRPYTTLDFQVGGGQMIKGFDSGVLGMKEKESKTITLQPADAYGNPRPELMQQVPVAVLKQNGINAAVGTQVATSNGAQGLITAIKGDNATIDFNHPLAGKVLVFKITVDKIKKKQ